MPWCDDCTRFYNPNTLDNNGDCPQGHHVAESTEDEAPKKLPWHFKLLVVALALYLGWRLVQGLSWLWDVLL